MPTYQEATPAEWERYLTRELWTLRDAVMLLLGDSPENQGNVLAWGKYDPLYSSAKASILAGSLLASVEDGTGSEVLYAYRRIDGKPGRPMDVRKAIAAQIERVPTGTETRKKTTYWVKPAIWAAWAKSRGYGIPCPMEVLILSRECQSEKGKRDRRSWVRAKDAMARYRKAWEEINVQRELSKENLRQIFHRARDGGVIEYESSGTSIRYEESSLRRFIEAMEKAETDRSEKENRSGLMNLATPRPRM